ncbi:MAG TPA: glycoside hydrolase family 15 protein [Micromonosporaceae bacterium]|nr:glycoside hydrolase family 15 protein [Micromonosporaceae bacterium]
MDDSPRRIADYGFLSDCRSAALVSRDGSVDWWCPGRFDAASVFARLLDDRAGHWSIRPAVPFRVRREYLAGSLVLRTVFDTAGGSVAVTDALAQAPGTQGHDLGVAAPQVLLRHVEGLAGAVPVWMECAPRMEYGRVTPRMEAVDGAVLATGGPAALRLAGTVPLAIGTGVATAELTVAAGDTYGWSLGYAPAYAGIGPAALDPRRVLDDTVAAWRSWADLHRAYDGFRTDLVRHSALVVQGLTYRPSGAVVAAPTTSLPEQLGGDRNYDYRYAWLRDFTLTMRALWVAACPDESDALFGWVAAATGQLGDGDPVPIMYGIEGERDLTERSLDHLAGFAGSRPVRVGNEAWRQRQHDVLGEVLDAAYLFRDRLGPLPDHVRSLLGQLADRAADAWRKPDSGMWEIRGAERHYLSSKVLCWVALDRAVRFGDALAGPASRERWAAERDAVRQAVLEQGWHDGAGAYTGVFGSAELDASVLVMPLVGFLPAEEPRMRATIAAVEARLGADGLVRRWAQDPAGFLLCTYWLVECLALAGEVDRAAEWFDRASGCANDLGLLAEQADPASGEQLGNFPQTFSHIGLVNAAWRLTEVTSGQAR